MNTQVATQTSLREQSSTPHEFSVLRSGNRPSIFFCGSGLSWGLVPLPYEIMRDHRIDAQQKLGCASAQTEDLYLWAEEILQQLADTPQSPARLKLAQSIGLTSAPAWTAGVDFANASPRHRVIARLSREELWPHIWTLNWDCLIENALEAIGFVKDGNPRLLPWKNTYTSVITAADSAKLQNTQLFCILKPHGCANALQEAEAALLAGDNTRAKELSDRFKITTTDLKEKQNSATDNMFYHGFAHYLTACPLLITGWSVGEPYLEQVLKDGVSIVPHPATPEELSIIDIAFNNGGHTKLIGYYQLGKQQVFFNVSKDNSGYSADDLYLWLQAKYFLEKILFHASASKKTNVQNFINATTLPSGNSFITDIADHFIPAWTRLCWRAGIIECAGFNPNDLPLEVKDEHIKLNTGQMPRRDLQAAANILATLPINGDGWNAQKYPGFIYDNATKELVIPLPAWGDINVLRSVKPLIDGIDGFGFIKSITILLVHYQDDWTADAVLMEQYKRMIADLMPAQVLAGSDNINVVHRLDGRS